MVYQRLRDLNSRWNKKLQKVPVGGSAISEKCQLEEVPIGGSLPPKLYRLDGNCSNFVSCKNLILFTASNDLTI